MLIRSDAIPAHPVAKLAIRFLAVTVVRSGTLMGTRWAEIDAIDPADPVWRIPAVRMTLRVCRIDDEARDHLVPLSRQVFETLHAERALTGRGLFMYLRGRSAHEPMSDTAMKSLLNRAGYHHRHFPHGWRSTFGSIMNERFPTDRANIDLMLAHVPKDWGRGRLQPCGPPGSGPRSLSFGPA